MTETAIRSALLGLFTGYARHQATPDVPTLSRHYREVMAAILSETPVSDRVAAIDEAMADFPESFYAEYCIDLLMLHVVATETEQKGEDYFDTPEWLEVEDETADRGSEALNLLLYVTEQREEDMPVALDDFLHEFLLVDEEEFQDELELYEEVIENEGLVELPYDEIYARGHKIADESALEELFVPLFWFFKRPAEPRRALEFMEKVKGERADVYTGLATSLLAYYNGLESLPEEYVTFAQRLEQ
jgi:hypothetical protein